MRDPGELEKLRQKLLKERFSPKTCVVISSGTCGQAWGSGEVVRAFRAAIKKRSLESKVTIRVADCHGFYEAKPNIIIYPDGIF